MLLNSKKKNKQNPNVIVNLCWWDKYKYILIDFKKCHQIKWHIKSLND